MSFFSPLFSSFRLKFYETTEASKNSPIIRSPIFLLYSPRILNFEIRKSGDDFFWNYHRHGHRFAKKKPMYKILILQAVIFPLSRRLYFRNSNGTIKTWKKFHSSAQSSSPQFSKLFLSFLFFFPFFFFSQIGGRVGDNSKKNHRRFYPPPEVRVSFARDASLEAHIPSPQSSFWSLTSAKGA